MAGLLRLVATVVYGRSHLDVKVCSLGNPTLPWSQPPWQSSSSLATVLLHGQQEDPLWSPSQTLIVTWPRSLLCHVRPKTILWCMDRGLLHKDVLHKSNSTTTVHRITQNHRMVGVGRDLCGSSGPTPLPKHGHLQQAAQDHVHVGFEYLQRRRFYNLPGQPVPVLRHPQSEEVFRHLQTELPLLQFVPIAPCPVAGHHRRESGPVLLRMQVPTISEKSCLSKFSIF